MDNENGGKSPYHGAFLSLFLLITVPLVFVIVLSLVLTGFRGSSKNINLMSARAIGFGLGTLFHLGCITCGMFGDSFKVVIKRIIGFFSDLRVSIGTAFHGYLWSIKHHGVTFWIYLLPVVACVGLFVKYFSEVIEILIKNGYF